MAGQENTNGLGYNVASRKKKLKPVSCAGRKAIIFKVLVLLAGLKPQIKIKPLGILTSIQENYIFLKKKSMNDMQLAP